MLCKNCGERLPDNAAVCPYCGIEQRIHVVPIDHMVQATSRRIKEEEELKRNLIMLIIYIIYFIFFVFFYTPDNASDEEELIAIAIAFIPLVPFLMYKAARKYREKWLRRRRR